MGLIVRLMRLEGKDELQDEILLWHWQLEQILWLEGRRERCDVMTYHERGQCDHAQSLPLTLPLQLSAQHTDYMRSRKARSMVVFRTVQA